jgi:hypothetical protein
LFQQELIPLFKGQNMTRAGMVWEYGQPDSNPYVDEWQALLDAIRGDRPHNEARRAGEADIVALMGRMATHTGQYVTWEQAAAPQTIRPTARSPTSTRRR